MAYDDFVNLAQRQDSKNNFQPCDADLSFVPEPLRLFYTTNNPISVEIVMHDLISIRFSPVKHLMQIQKEYNFDDFSFIFATQEGDPIYHKTDGIFICSHGTSTLRETKICDSFDSYIKILSKEMIEKSK